METIMFLELRLSGCLPFPVATVFISVALMGKMPRLLGQFSSWMEDTNVLRRKEGHECVEEERGNVPS